MWRFKISLMRIFLKGFVDFFIAVKFPTLSDFLLMLNVYRVNEVDSLPLISMAIDSGLSLCNILLVNIGSAYILSYTESYAAALDLLYWFRMFVVISLKLCYHIDFLQCVKVDMCIFSNI